MARPSVTTAANVKPGDRRRNRAAWRVSWRRPSNMAASCRLLGGAAPERLDHVRAHVANLLGRERAAERRHVVATGGHRLHGRVEISHSIEWRAAVVALAIGTMTGDARLREDAFAFGEIGGPADARP